MGPRMRRASCMSFGMIVTRLAWMAHRLQSSKSPTITSSAASCSAHSASAVHRKGSRVRSFPISRTSRANGSFRIRSSVLRWYLRISLRAASPGRRRCFRFVGVFFLAGVPAPVSPPMRGVVADAKIAKIS